MLDLLFHDLHPVLVLFNGLLKVDELEVPLLEPIEPLLVGLCSFWLRLLLLLHMGASALLFRQIHKYLFGLLKTEL